MKKWNRILLVLIFALVILLLYIGVQISLANQDVKGFDFNIDSLSPVSIGTFLQGGESR